MPAAPTRPRSRPPLADQARARPGLLARRSARRPSPPCARYIALALLLEGDGGAIVTVTSVNGRQLFTAVSGYSGAKAAPSNLGKAPGEEFAPQGGQDGLLLWRRRAVLLGE